MLRQAKQPDENEADLESTAELPALDVASYEERVASCNRDREVSEPEASNSAQDECPPQEVAGLPLSEILRDIETWVAAQNARAREDERILAEVQAARTDAQARADNLALTLEVTRNALQTALGRANDGERAALDHSAAAQAAESRAAELCTALEQARRELATADARIVAVTAELARTSDSLAAGVRQREEMQQRQSELGRELDGGSNRMAQLDGELVSLRARIAETDRELAQRNESIAAIQEAHAIQQGRADDLARERDALAARFANFSENVQSIERKRGVWEGMWHELDTELANARALLARSEAERGGLAATNDKLYAELAERDAIIARLETDLRVQSTAFEELAAIRLREEQGYVVSAQEAHVRGETSASEIKALELQNRRSAESLAARDTELAESRANRSALEETLRSLQSSDSAHRTRVVELEGLSDDFGRALQTQTDATDRANASIDSRERELADERARASGLETQLQAAVDHSADRAAAAQSTETALNASLAQLAASHDRLANFERAAASQSERLMNLQVELTHAEALAEEREASRDLLQNELERVRTELKREAMRASALDDAQRKLALELERTRGALDERELQQRRLERYATSSAQVLSRIKAGIERGGNETISEIPEFSDEVATLVPLDDSDAPPLMLGPLTTIGRAPESNLCLRDSSVSRRHAVVTIGSKGAFIEDIRSVNGVTVNSQRIRHARLADGDVIELGLKRFRFMTSAERSADAG